VQRRLIAYVSPREIELTVATLSPERAVDTLIEIANDRGGADNVSVIVLRSKQRLTKRDEIAAGPAPLAATAALRAADLPDEPPPLPPAPRRAASRCPTDCRPTTSRPPQSAWAVLLTSRAATRSSPPPR